MWAERQAQARLAPQIEALRAELERTYAQAFDDSVHMVTLYASHDEALSTLREFALQQAHAQTQGQLHLDIRFTGSVDAIRALNEGRCAMAGFHTLLDSSARSLTASTYKPLLRPGLHKIIGFAQRAQGLIVAKGNPLGLHSMVDVAAKQARFANRALGTGTRVVLDELLARATVPISSINRYDHTEPSHAAVANAVAAAQFDVGLGIAAAAQQLGLDFVPLAEERYHLVCLKSALSHPATLALLQLLKMPEWHAVMRGIPGYSALQSGEVLAMRRVLPWWDYRQKKVHASRS
jgi:molybdate-binding protein